MSNQIKVFVFKDTRTALEKSTRRRTPEGYLIVDAIIARTGIQEYRGYELPQNSGYDFISDKVYRIYRSPKEVFSEATLQSFVQKPVTNEHPHDVGGLVNSDTATQKLVGVSGNKIVRHGEQIKVPLTIYSSAAINDIEQGKTGISAGYTGDIKMVPGLAPDGQAYDGIVINIRGNHVAMCDVDDARGGRGCRLLDTRGESVKNGMGEDPNAMGGADGVPDLSDINQLAQMLQTLAASIKEGFAAIITAVKGDDESEADDAPLVEGVVTDEDPAAEDDKKNKKDNTAVGKMTDTKAMSAVIKLQKEVAYLRGQLQVSKRAILTDSQIHRVASARVKLMREAEQVLPGIDLAILDSVDIKKRVIKAVMPEAILDSNPAFIDGAYQTCVSTFLNGANSSYNLANAIKDSYGTGGLNGAGEFDEVDSGEMSDRAFQDLQERRRKAFVGSK